MKKVALVFAILLMWTGSGALSEEGARRAINQADVTGIIEFAENYGAGEAARQALGAALSGKGNFPDAILIWCKEQLAAPLRDASQTVLAFLPLIFLMVILRCTLPSPNGGAQAVLFMLRLKLMLAFSEMASSALEETASCLQAAGRFSGIAAPAITLLMTSVGMDGTAALVSPAASLAGDLVLELFAKYGLQLCRLGLCTAIAGNFSKDLSLGRLTRLVRKTANWGTGLAIALFTALLALQGSVTEGLDGVAVRTAKYAVDSASSVIGSGVSDVWESYVSGVMIAKNALGVSAIVAILASSARPMLQCLLNYAVLSITAALLDIFGEREGTDCAEQIAGICQMALSLCTGAMAVVVILLGAAMAAGQNLLA